ncbi:AraC family transcriptional regulator [Nocardioides aestuarii]|uniref:AraC family transcriptional regulator n=1 Tax=Nocardioides aestuarii TaxID=252231 RepID=A0ABW4TLD5_9ACTN
MGVIRASGLLGYRELVRELGANPDPLLRSAGVRPSDAGDHDTFISYRSLVIAVELGAEATGAPDFGRQLATRQGIEILGPVGVAARTAATMGEALEIFTTYLSAYSPAIAVAAEPLPDPERTFFSFQVVASGIPAHRHTTELSLGIALDVFRFLRGDAYEPVSVHLDHAPLTDEEDYRDYFACPPHFQERRSGLTMRTEDLAKPLTGDSQAHQVILRYLDGLVSTDEGGTVAPTRRLVRQLLPTGAVTLVLVARQLAMHPKTFQRRLAAEGTTFGDVLEDTRRELVEHYLRDTDLGLVQVARELGYAEQSVLTRSVKRWFGTGPAELREQLRSPRQAAAGPAAVGIPPVEP